MTNEDNLIREGVPNPFRLFVYGTLKRGYWNHEAYCGYAAAIEEAVVRGTLYELPSGIPVLKVPDEDIVAVGTPSPNEDQWIQNNAVVGQGHSLVEDDLVHGELMSFDDADLRLPRIDGLEGYSPGVCALYRRVLVPVYLASGEVVLAWCYVAGPEWRHEGARTIGPTWPSE